MKQMKFQSNVNNLFVLKKKKIFTSLDFFFMLWGLCIAEATMGLT